MINTLNWTWHLLAAINKRPSMNETGDAYFYHSGRKLIPSLHPLTIRLHHIHWVAYMKGHLVVRGNKKRQRKSTCSFV